MNPTSALLTPVYAQFKHEYPENPIDLPPAVEVAKRRLLRKSDSFALKNPATFAAAHPHANGSFSAVLKKTQDVALSVLKWAADTRVVVFCAAGILKISRSAITWGGPSESSIKQMDRVIEELSGQPQLAKIIHATAPLVARLLQQQLIKLNLYEGLNLFLKEEHTSLTGLVDFLMSKMYSNIARSIKNSSIETYEGAKQNVTFVDVVSCLIKVVNAHLPHIRVCVESVEKITDPQKREKKLCELFTHLVDDFLLLALPQGEKELPIADLGFISQKFWGKIKTRLLPLIFLDVYKQLARPLKCEAKPSLLARQGGESLVSLAELLGEKAGEVLPTLCVSDNSSVFSSSFMGMVTESFTSSLRISEAVKHWLRDWIRGEISALGQSTNSDIKNMWMFFGAYLEPVLIHIFYHMSGMPASPTPFKGVTPDALGIMTMRVLTVCSSFFNASHTAIEERIAALKSAKKDFLNDQILLNLFLPLTEDLIHMMGLERPECWPLPDFLKDVAHKHLKEKLPRFLLKQYLAMTNSQVSDKETREKLRSIVFDSRNLEDPAITTKVVTALHQKGVSGSTSLFTEFYQALWHSSGTENIAKALEAMCAAVANDSVNAAMRHFGINSQPILNVNSNRFMSQATQYSKKWVESTLLGILVNVLESVDNKTQFNETGHAKQFLLLNVIQGLVGIFDRGLAHVTDKIKNIPYHPIKEQRLYSQEIRNVFAPLADELHALSGINPLNLLPLDGLPSAENVKEMLWTAVRMTVLPDFLATIYSEISSWMNQQQRTQAQLEQCYHTTHPKWAAHVLAKYTTDFIRHYLRAYSKDTSEAFLKTLLDYMTNSDAAHSAENAALLRNQSAAIRAMLDNNVRQFGESYDVQVVHLWPALTLYLEAIFSKIIAGISKTIQEAQDVNPDLLIDLAIGMLGDMAEYFKVINRVIGECGKGSNSQLPSSVILAAFGSHLHGGVPLDPEACEEEKQRVRLEGHFIPLTNKLLELANLSASDFPLPSALKEPIMELVLGKILPNALMQANLTILEPRVLDALLLNFIQTLHEALKEIDSNPKKAMAVVEREVDPKQKALNATCGSLVLQLVKLIPDSMVQYVFMKEKVQNMSAETIGESLMPYLSRFKILKLVDMILFYGMLNFHPSRWVGKEGSEELRPLKAIKGPDGTFEFKSAPKFKFVFPETQAAVNEAKVKLESDAQKTHTLLRNKFTETISDQLRIKMWNYIKSLWDNFQSILDDFIERAFPGKGLKVKAVIDTIFHKIFIDMIGAVIAFFIVPMINKIQYFIDRGYIEKRAESLIKSLHSETIEHLIYKWTDRLIISLSLSPHRGV